MLYSLSLFFVLFTTSSSDAAQNSDFRIHTDLIIHGVEIGVGKFHRYDNQVRPYSDENVWKNYILPENSGAETPVVVENADSSVSIFFSNLEELLVTLTNISKERGQAVDVLNINAHGLPGAMWFPVDEKEQNSAACTSWVASANAKDKANYDQYYSTISMADIVQLTLFSKLPSMQFAAPCTTGASEWEKILKKHPEVKTSFADDAQLHLLSCLVGLGWAGSKFTAKLGELLFVGENAKVQAALDFGLGDWSMPEGMGFWDYQDYKQFSRDNKNYPVNRSDREMMQKGEIRLAIKKNNEWKLGVVSDLDFMLVHKDSLDLPAENRLFSTASTDAIEEADQPLSAAELQNLKGQSLNFRIPGAAAQIRIELK